MATSVETRRRCGSRVINGATSGATDGGAGASGWVFRNFGLDVGLDWCAIQTVVLIDCQHKLFSLGCRMVRDHGIEVEGSSSVIGAMKNGQQSMNRGQDALHR